MSTFTIRLAELIDAGFDLGMTSTDYPIFDEDHRADLNTRIVDHYALYEIGHETPQMFRFALNRKLREIMPYYNKLYESEKIQFDPLSTMDYTDDTTSDSTSSTTSEQASHNTNTANAKARSVNSELPQVHLSPDEDYASSGADSTSETTTAGDGTVTGTDNGSVNGTVSHATKGRQGPAASLLMNYRNSLLNIDMMVVQECAELFMGVVQTSDDYTTNERFWQ
jgi:hypothetical protein